VSYKSARIVWGCSDWQKCEIIADPDKKENGHLKQIQMTIVLCIK